jgi:hypothetical protein
MGNTVSVGSKHLAPVAWAVVGPKPASRMFRVQWHEINGLIDHYTRRYEEPCHCLPVTLYQKDSGRTALSDLVKASTKKVLNNNMLMATAISFLKDVIENGGPDTTELFDLFTNDMRHSPETVDIGIWKRAREKSMFPHRESQAAPPIAHQRLGYSKKEQKSAQTCKMLKVSVEITDEGDDITATAKKTKFRNIEKVVAEEHYWQSMYEGWW